MGEYSLSLQFMEHALRLNRAFHGERSLKLAVAHHLVARTQSCLGDFRAALQNEKETFAIYKQQVYTEDVGRVGDEVAGVGSFYN